MRSELDGRDLKRNRDSGGLITWRDGLLPCSTVDCTTKQ